jgi:hypothetical protein
LPGIGCTPEKLFDMHNDMLGVYDMGKLEGNPIDYVPDIEYYVYDIIAVGSFILEHPEEKVFIDNGIVQSMQADNFPMNEIIYEIAINHKDKAFIVTHDIPLKAQNIYSTSSITKTQGFDLPEISYLSTFCSTLIGRNSGPHVFSQVKKNVMDRNKKLLSFTYHQQGSSFVVNTPVKIKRYWSGETETEKVIRKIEEVLSE